MHMEAKKRRERMEAKKKKGKGGRTVSIDGIEERSEIHEQDGKVSSSLLSGNFKDHTDIMTQSKMNLMKNALEGGGGKDGEDILQSQKSLTYIECKYLLSVLMNRSVQANWVKENSFDTFYTKARTTLRI